MIDLSMEALQRAYNVTSGDLASRLISEAYEEHARPRCPECHSAETVEVRHVIYEYADVLGVKDEAPYNVLLLQASDDHELRYCDKQPEDGQPEWMFWCSSCDAEWELDPDHELEWV